MPSQEVFAYEMTEEARGRGWRGQDVREEVTGRQILLYQCHSTERRRAEEFLSTER